LDAARFEHAEGRVGVSRAIDQIPDAKHSLDIHRLQRVEHSPKRFGLAVNIADDPQPAEHAPVAHHFNLGAF
jgi:hypothetical protein